MSSGSPVSRERAAGIRLVIFDVDGVFTDGRLYLGESGEEMRAFCVHDGFGVRLLIQAGVAVAVLSGRASKILGQRMAELGVRHCITGRSDKWEAFGPLAAEIGVSPEEVCYVGDDLVDLPLLRRVGLSAAPADAHPEVRRAVDWVTERPGGGGAVREICETILKAREEWQKTLARYR